MNYSRKLPRFHRWMLFTSVSMISISALFCRVLAVNTNWWETCIALAVALAAMSPLPLYWHEKRRYEMREGALTIAWAFVFAVILPISVVAAARLHMPLQDANLVRLDAELGINVPRFASWAAQHAVGTFITRTYPLLIPLLPVALLVPALTGRWQQAREFVLANVIAFAVGIPMFALLPAIGPWYGYHCSASVAQLQTQMDLLGLRTPGPYTFHPMGIVCFPSFHVVWAILCARALSSAPWLKVPAALLSAMIIVSTMTTGWHYFSDVLAGVIVATLSICMSEALLESDCDQVEIADVQALAPASSCYLPPLADG